MYRHPIVDDVDFVERARRREAAEHRLASASRRAAPQGTRLRTRVGALLVRAGYSLGAPGPDRLTAGRDPLIEGAHLAERGAQARIE